MIAVYPHSVPLNRENVPNCYLSSFSACGGTPGKREPVSAVKATRTLRCFWQSSRAEINDPMRTHAVAREPF
jgi:hypothetical protein